MEIKIEVDDYEIISSGTILIDGNKNLSFDFIDKDLKFKIKFTEDSQIEYSKFDTKLNEEENYLEINIINSSQGQLLGNQGLASLATIDGKQLYLKFRVTVVGEEIKDVVFNYSWYLK